MMDISGNLTTALEEFGLETKEIATFLELNRKPWVTVVELAERVEIPRPTLYRILSALQKKGLVETHVDHKTTYYAVSPLENFKTHIIEAEKRTKSLEDAFNTIRNGLQIHLDHDASQTAVSFFRGVNSIRSLEWELTKKRNSETLVFGNNTWWKYLGEEFAEEMRQRYADQQITTREILNEEHKKYLNDDWTQVKLYKEELYQQKYISKNVLPIDNEITLSNGSVYLYVLNQAELVGIKISSQTYFNTMKSLFEMAWNVAEKS